MAQTKVSLRKNDIYALMNASSLVAQAKVSLRKNDIYDLMNASSLVAHT